MAKKITHFEDNELNRQFNEILSNLTEENFRDNRITLTSEDGTEFYLKVDNTGTLYTEEV